MHACHSKVRELEILHDQLLKRFNDNPDWHPGDVIVMMPDVATYAPFIEGVFGAVDNISWLSLTPYQTAMWVRSHHC